MKYLRHRHSALTMLKWVGGRLKRQLMRCRILNPATTALRCMAGPTWVRALSVTAQKSVDRWCVALIPAARPHAAVASMMSSEATMSAQNRMFQMPWRPRKPRSLRTGAP